MSMDSTFPSKDIIWQIGLKRSSNNMLFTETHFIDRNKHLLRVKGWKIYQDNAHPKQARVTILTSDKVDFKLISQM
jgi:hypothetical protein